MYALLKVNDKCIVKNCEKGSFSLRKGKRKSTTYIISKNDNVELLTKIGQDIDNGMPKLKISNIGQRNFTENVSIKINNEEREVIPCEQQFSDNNNDTDNSAVVNSNISLLISNSVLEANLQPKELLENDSTDNLEFLDISRIGNMIHRSPRAEAHVNYNEVISEDESVSESEYSPSNEDNLSDDDDEEITDNEIRNACSTNINANTSEDMAVKKSTIFMKPVKRIAWTNEEKEVVINAFHEKILNGVSIRGQELVNLIKTNSCVSKRTVPQIRIWLYIYKTKQTKEK